jgi:hypothetical protein
LTVHPLAQPVMLSGHELNAVGCNKSGGSGIGCAYLMVREQLTKRQVALNNDHQVVMVYDQEQN